MLPEAVTALCTARKYIAKLDLEKNYTAVGDQTITLHPWLGTGKTHTLLYLLNHTFKEDLKIQSASLVHCGMAIQMISEIPAEDFFAEFMEKIKKLNEESLIDAAPPMIHDRYDPFVPESLLKKAFVYDRLDICGIRKWAKQNR